MRRTGHKLTQREPESNAPRNPRRIGLGRRLNMVVARQTGTQTETSLGEAASHQPLVILQGTEGMAVQLAPVATDNRRPHHRCHQKRAGWWSYPPIARPCGRGR